MINKENDELILKEDDTLAQSGIGNVKLGEELDKLHRCLNLYVYRFFLHPR